MPSAVNDAITRPMLCQNSVRTHLMLLLRTLCLFKAAGSSPPAPRRMHTCVHHVRCVECTGCVVLGCWAQGQHKEFAHFLAEAARCQLKSEARRQRTAMMEQLSNLPDFTMQLK